MRLWRFPALGSIATGAACSRQNVREPRFDRRAYGSDVVAMLAIKVALRNKSFDLRVSEPDLEEAHALAPTFPECAHTCC
jgi:hypothetical protein